MNNDKYISPNKLYKQFNITSGTLRHWAEAGKIRYLRPNQTGKRIYNIEDIKKILGITNTDTDKKRICYARVSSNHQKEDLERQVEFLKKAYPEAIIIKDIGSGLNWKRPGFISILEQVHSGTVSEVVVSYKDRLCRFGSELVEWIFKKADVKLLVLNESIREKDLSRELSDDLLAITTVFVAKNNGIRAGIYKRQRKKDEQENLKKESGDRQTTSC